jgi:hypothetical protein
VVVDNGLERRVRQHEQAFGAHWRHGGFEIHNPVGVISRLTIERLEGHGSRQQSLDVDVLGKHEIHDAECT